MKFVENTADHGLEFSPENIRRWRRDFSCFRAAEASQLADQRMGVAGEI